MPAVKKKALRPGRPVTIAATAVISIKMPPALTASIDKWAASEKVTRSEAARRLIELGLKAKGKAR